MFVYGIRRERLDELADSVGLRLADGRAAGSLRLRHAHYWPRAERPWQAIMPARTGCGTAVDNTYVRRTGVCWHGYMAFFGAVYEENGSAHVKTALAEWTDSDNYRNTVRNTPRWNDQVKCWCDEDDRRAAYRGELEPYWKQEKSLQVAKHATRQARRVGRDISKARAIMAAP